MRVGHLKFLASRWRLTRRSGASWETLFVRLRPTRQQRHSLRFQTASRVERRWDCSQDSSAPLLAKAAFSPKLRKGFEEHLQQTKGQVQRLERIFSTPETRAGGKKCVGMEGVIQEGAEVIEETYEGALMDAALISAAQRVEHHEIAGYGAVIAYAEFSASPNMPSCCVLEQTEAFRRR
jgi:hypothetical protein